MSAIEHVSKCLWCTSSSATLPFLLVMSSKLPDLRSSLKPVVCVECTNLISISPEIILCPDVHVRVLGALLDGAFVGLVLPVLAPQAPRVD